MRRIATISVHTSPLDQPGTGDAGGMNVYIVAVARRLAAAGVEVEIFTRATSSHTRRTVELAPGVWVRTVVAGPFEGLAKADVPAEMHLYAHGGHAFGLRPAEDKITRWPKLAEAWLRRIRMFSN